MNAGFRPQCVPSYRFLTEEQVRELHLATLEVLETVGVRVRHPEGLALLADHGCRVGPDEVVRLPNWLVEACIRTVPSRLTLYDRAGREAMLLEGRKVYFGMGTDLIRTYDLRTGELRPSRLEDVANAARIADALEDIDFIASFALPQDVPTNAMYVESFRAQVENSTKPIFFTAAGAADLEVIAEIAAAAAGGPERLRERPFLINYSEPTSPLTHSRGAVDKLFLCADRGIPVNYTPAILAGASGPVTLAGSVVTANAEALSGVVLHQLRARGAPLISGFAATVMDMGTSAVSYGCPELRLTHSACTDLYRHYGIPVWSTAGASDAHALDGQAATEHAIGILMAALDGANLVHDVGYLGQGLTGSPASLVLADETIRYVKRILRGFDVSRESIGLDVIRSVGPGGNFLAEDQTLALYAREHWRPRLFNRDDPETWAGRGSPTAQGAATRRALELLETHRPEPLPEGAAAEIARIAERAARELADRHFEA